MARKSLIVVEGNPKGRFQEIIVSGTPKPGTMMEVVPATLPKGEVFTYRAVSRGDGAKGPIAVLTEDTMQGVTVDIAYVSGARGWIYWPAEGEFINVLLKYQPGTGTNLNENIGDLLEVDGATGKMQGIGTTGPTTNHVSAPFTLMEHLGVALTTDKLVLAQFLGNNA